MKILLASALIMMVALLIGVQWTSYSSQQSNLRVAGEATLVLEKQFGNESKFMNVRFGAYTGGGGQLWITGTVNDHESLEALRSAVSKLRLSIPIKWDVSVQP